MKIGIESSIKINSFQQFLNLEREEQLSLGLGKISINGLVNSMLQRGLKRKVFVFEHLEANVIYGNIVKSVKS